MKIRSYLPYIASTAILVACSSTSSNDPNNATGGSGGESSTGGTSSGTFDPSQVTVGSNATIDTNGDGTPDGVPVDTNDDGTPDAVVVDANGDGVGDTVLVANPDGTYGAGGASNGGAGGTDQGVGGEAQGGTAGVAQGGVAGNDVGGAGGASTGGVGVDDECAGEPPPAPIADLITAQPERYTHNIGGHPFAVDLSAPIIMGKLIVDLGVSSGGVYGFGVDRGFHTYGGEIQPQCNLSYNPSPSTHNGDCRLNRVDGLPYGDQNTDNPASSLFGGLKAGLQELSVTQPGQGWEYFLDSNGELRLQDIGFTGYSHGAQTVARIAVAYCVWRSVSRSGPRDNECGNGAMTGNYDPGTGMWPTPAYDEPCDRYSTWIMDPPASPMSHFYSFGGKNDGQFGDFQWTVAKLGGGFIGEPVNISTTPPGDSHIFYADDGHSGFEGQQYWPALQKAWNVPQENMDFAAGN